MRTFSCLSLEAHWKRTHLAKTGDVGPIPGPARSPGGEGGNPLQYSSWRIPWTEEPSGLRSGGSQSRTWLSVWAWWKVMYLVRSTWYFEGHSPHTGEAVCILTGNPLHRSLPASNFERCERVFHRCQAWALLQLALRLLLLMILQLYRLPLRSLLRSVTPLLACSLDAAPVSQLLYRTAVVFKILYHKIKIVFCVCFYVLSVWKALWTYYIIVLYSRLW